jgi:hypothetical protein
MNQKGYGRKWPWINLRYYLDYSFKTYRTKINSSAPSSKVNYLQF